MRVAIEVDNNRQSFQYAFEFLLFSLIIDAFRADMKTLCLFFA